VIVYCRFAAMARRFVLLSCPYFVTVQDHLLSHKLLIHNKLAIVMSRTQCKIDD